MLQAMKEEPPLNAKCKDKFLIQSTLITQEKEDRPLQEIVRWLLPCCSSYLTLFSGTSAIPRGPMRKSTNRNSKSNIFVLRARHSRKKKNPL